jgi:hypothetical protein
MAEDFVVRILTCLTVLFFLTMPDVTHGQSFELHGSAGPTITDRGNSFALGAGFSPTSRLTVVVGVDRTHLSSRTRREGDVTSTFRGGTLLLGTAEVRFAPFAGARVGPFALAGVAAGVSRPNVNETFPTRVRNDVRAVFVGGGVNVPLSDTLAFVADARMLLGAERIDGIVAVAPVRAGIVWRF